MSQELLNIIPNVSPDGTGWPNTHQTSIELYNKRKDWPKFSIIIPSYNHGEFIETTIRSILLQNYPNLELIIIDGGSNDQTVDTINKYEEWIDYWVSEKDHGQSHAINKGISKSNGKFINWVNSDDWLAENALFEIANYFLDHSEVDLVYGNCNIVYPGIKTDLYESVEFDPIDFVSRISIHQPSTFWRAKLFEEIGTIDESLHFCMDFDFWARIVFNHKTERLDKILANFRRYPESKSSNFDDQTNVYNDYRNVVSRIITTVYEDAVPLLNKLDLNYNKLEIKYNINPSIISVLLKKKMLKRYILTCALQEYNLNNVGRSNQLLKHSFSKDNFKEASLALIKNNTGYRKIFHPYRKSEY